MGLVNCFLAVHFQLKRKSQKKKSKEKTLKIKTFSKESSLSHVFHHLNHLDLVLDDLLSH